MKLNIKKVGGCIAAAATGIGALILAGKSGFGEELGKTTADKDMKALTPLGEEPKTEEKTEGMPTVEAEVVSDKDKEK